MSRKERRNLAGTEDRRGDGPPAGNDGLDGRLLIGLRELAGLCGVSLRHLRRLDAAREIPGRVKCGKRVLFGTDAVREWVRGGMTSAGRRGRGRA